MGRWSRSAWRRSASLGGADEARALPPVPIGGGLGGAIGAGVDAITGGLGGAAVDGFSALLGKLFAWPAEVINRRLLAWLVAVPDYAISPRATSGGRAGSNLAELASTTSAMAFALLAAVGTVAGLRYWAAGLSGSGGFDALEGLGRTVGGGAVRGRVAVAVPARGGSEQRGGARPAGQRQRARRHEPAARVWRSRPR